MEEFEERAIATVDCERLVARGEYRTRFLAAPPAAILEQTELTLPPTLLAARGSQLEYHTCFLAAPPAGILEQKRDCSQSIATATYKPKIWKRYVEDSFTILG